MEELKNEIIRYNRSTNNAINAIVTAIDDLSSYEAAFDGQRDLIARLNMARRVLNAAIGQLNILRPKITMIKEEGK